MKKFDDEVISAFKEQYDQYVQKTRLMGLEDIYTKAIDRARDLLKAQIAEIDTAINIEFTSRRLDHAKLYGDKIIMNSAIALAKKDEYLQIINDQPKKKEMIKQEFQIAWKRTMDKIYSEEDMKNLKKINFKFCWKFFKGAWAFLPNLSP